MGELASLSVSPLWLVILGFGVGILSGLLGVGGGILMTPALHILGMSMPMAVATSLTQMVGASLSGSIKHARHRHVSLALALLFGIPGLIGITLGKSLMVSWPREEADHALSLLYLGIMSYISWNMARQYYLGPRQIPGAKTPAFLHFGPKLELGPGKRKVAVIPSCLAGVGVGLLSSLTGLGGGFFYIPALMHLSGCSMKQAVGTSLATVCISSLYGAVVYGAAGVSDIPAALLLMVGAVAGAQVGATAAHRAQDRRLQLLLLILVISAMVSMILERLDFVLLAEILLFGSGTLIVGLALASTFLRSKKPSQS